MKSKQTQLNNKNTGLYLRLSKDDERCPDCGKKMRVVWNKRLVRGVYTDEIKFSYICGGFMESGKSYCHSKQIRESVINEIVLQDIQAKANFVWTNEQNARAEFLRRKMQQTSEEQKADAKQLKTDKRRLEELDKLIQCAYEIPSRAQRLASRESRTRNAVQSIPTERGGRGRIYISNKKVCPRRRTYARDLFGTYRIHHDR